MDGEVKKIQIFILSKSIEYILYDGTTLNE